MPGGVLIADRAVICGRDNRCPLNYKCADRDFVVTSCIVRNRYRISHELLIDGKSRPLYIADVKRIGQLSSAATPAATPSSTPDPLEPDPLGTLVNVS